MFKILIIASFLAASSAYLNHGPAIINQPNYGLYNGGYDVREHGLNGNYLTPGLVQGKVPFPAPLPLIQKLGHTGYAYAPARNFAINPTPAIVPQVHPQAYAGQTGHIGLVGHVNPVGHVRPLGQIGAVGYAGHVGHLGHAGYAGHLGHISPVGNVGQVGHLGHGGYHSGAQGSYVVPPSVTFSQNAPQQIAPVAPISRVVRIPYSYPVINSPQPVSQAVSHPIAAPGHAW